MFSPIPKFSIAAVLALGLAGLLAGCGEQGYGPTHSYSARYDGNGTAAAANNGSVSSSVLAQEHKEANYATRAYPARVESVEPDRPVAASIVRPSRASPSRGSKFYTTE